MPGPSTADRPLHRRHAMWFTTLLESVRRGPECRPNRQRHVGRPWRFLPRLESLEDRTVPSTLTVVNAFDKGAGSLRDTISHANSDDTIVFDAGLNGQTII